MGGWHGGVWERMLRKHMTSFGLCLSIPCKAEFEASCEYPDIERHVAMSYARDSTGEQILNSCSKILRCEPAGGRDHSAR